MSRPAVSRATAAWSSAIKRGVRAVARALKAPPAVKRAKPLKQAKASPAKRLAPIKRVPAAKRATATRRVSAVSSVDWLPGVAMVAAGACRYWLYRPPGLRTGERLPLVVMLHGCAQDAAGFAASTRMNALARRERFLVLYPEQSRMDHPQACWNWYETRLGHAQREVARIMAAVGQVGLRQPVDVTRVALVGLSAGASMAALLATRHPSHFQALVMHSGIAPGVADSTATALAAMLGQRLPAARTPGQPAEHWPPLMVIQGDNDPVVSPRNGQATAQAWADGLGAHPSVARTVQRGQRYPMTVTDFKRGGRTVVSLVAVARLGHAWSGGVASQPFSDAKGPDATGMAWTFVSRQFRHVGPANRPTDQVKPGQ